MSQNNKGEPKNQKIFIDAWLSDPAFEGWLAKEKDSKKKARFTVCHKSIEPSSSGRSVLTHHAKGKKHKEIIVSNAKNDKKSKNTRYASL